MRRKQIKSRPGLFGMIYYYDENGNPIGKSRPGLIEGTRVYTDQNGRYAGKSRPGFLAKEVFADTEHNHITSYDSFCGEVHFKNGVPVGHTSPGFFDSAYTILEGEDELPEDEEYYAEDIFDEAWDEDVSYEEDDSCEKYTPKVSRYSIVKTLQFFTLFLGLCMVIVCIYAIATP